MRVLVTGGSGFVGTAVVRQLLQRGHAIVATCSRWRPGLQPGLEWVDWNAMLAPLPAIDWTDLEGLIHLATPTSSTGGEAPLFDVAVAATFRLLEQCRSVGIGRALIASTGDVLGGTPGPAREDDVNYAPSSFYGTAKACGELVARAYAPSVATAVLRFYHPYGPGGDRFLINRLIHAVEEGEEIRIEGGYGIRLNPVWIDDLAAGVCQALESDRRGIFHLAGEETLTLRALVELVGELVGRPPRLVSVDRPVIERHVGDCEQARRAFGYLPRVGLREGLGRLVRQAGRDSTPAHETSGLERPRPS